MAEKEITFRNNSEIKVQAQIFTGRTLCSTCLAGPGEIHTLPTQPDRYDIFLKNGTTGYEVARKLDSEATNLTLSRQNGRYIISSS